MKDPPATRPCTSYSMFFQLEREYILQNILDYKPTISPKDMFDTTNETYPAEAPPLPSCYEDLLLPYDWHIPGKARRRKRKHCKSHGKIGFNELNMRISKAWSEADDEIRDFCQVLSDITARNYTKILMKTTEKNVKRKRSKSTVSATPTKSELKDEVNKATNAKEKEVKRERSKHKTSVTKPMKSDPKYDNSTGISSPFDRTARIPKSDSVVDFPSPNLNTSMSTPSMCCHVSHGTTNNEVDGLYRTSSLRKSFQEVDMGDDEIFNIWNNTLTDDNAFPFILPTTPQLCIEIIRVEKGATVKEDDKGVPFRNAECEAVKGNVQQSSTKKTPPPEDSANLPCSFTTPQFCVEIVNYTDVTITAQGGKKINKDAKRQSFIDAEYEKYKEIGQHFSGKK